MTIDVPGLPRDLPTAEVLWGRCALLAVLEATTEGEQKGHHRTGTWVDDDGLRLDDSGTTWWTFAPRGEGRYVLFGEDESSAVKWHEPPIDMLADAPGWLPHERLKDLLSGYELGRVPWYGNGAWARTTYPGTLGDDGLDCGMSRFADRAAVLRTVADQDHGATSAQDAEAILTHAENRRPAPELLLSPTTGPGRRQRDRPAMTGALERAGLNRP